MEYKWALVSRLLAFLFIDVSLPAVTIPPLVIKLTFPIYSPDLIRSQLHGAAGAPLSP